jgi:hypothetical protein
MLLWLSLVGSYSFDFFLNKNWFWYFFLLKEKIQIECVIYPPHTQKKHNLHDPFFFRPIYYVSIKYKSCCNFLYDVLERQ